MGVVRCCFALKLNVLGEEDKEDGPEARKKPGRSPGVLQTPTSLLTSGDVKLPLTLSYNYEPQTMLLA